MTDPADQPFDDIDDAIINQLRTVSALVDPPPSRLDEQVQFAIALENIDIEVARVQEDLLVGSGTRGTERTRTITFDSKRLTIVITVVEIDEGRVRVDGWLAPAAQLAVELRFAESPGDTRGRSHLVTADEAGRFALSSVERGLAQVLVHPSAGLTATVVTPSLML